MRKSNRRGAAVVEFAVVAPIFFMLVFGMIEYGRLVQVQQVLTNASREGARVASTAGTSQTEATTWVNNYLQSAGINPADVFVRVVPSPPKDGEPITVELKVPFSKVAWFPPFMVKNDLTALTTFKREKYGE
jgi:hypothetical protein